MDEYDFIIVGAGAVGLHAALKSAVLNHTVLLLDKGPSFARVRQAPRIANVPGAPGISGEELLRRGREALATFEDLSGKRLVTLREEAEAYDARRDGASFVVRYRDASGDHETKARALVLATGLVDRKPAVGDYHAKGHETLSPFVARGGIGYCLLCEGWDLAGRRIAVVGATEESAQVAEDVQKHFDGDVTLLTDGEPLADAEAAARLRQAGVQVDERPLAGIFGDEGHVHARFADGEDMRFEKALLCMGWYKVNNELAVCLGARTTREGFVVTDESSEAIGADGQPIRGLFAVGDVRAGRWKQIVVGWGDAETAVITAYAYRIPG